MTCADMEGRLAGYIAGEGGDRSGVEEHLVACADCRANFALARSGWDAAAEWKVGEPSPDAISSVLAAVEREPREANGFVRFLQAGTLAASLLIAFAVGTSRRESPAPEPAPPETSKSKAPVSTGLASIRPSVGMLFVQDEDGKPAGELSIRRLDVKVDIRDGIARTEIEEIFENRTDARLEGTFHFPLPPDASISRLAMEIEGKLMEGEVVERKKARETYEGIVRSMKDPALLEWMPGGIFQCRIFPIEPRSQKRIVIAYTQALSVFDGRARYVYPLAGESMRDLGIGRFEFSALIRAPSKLVSSGSTSHDATTIRLDDRTMRTTFGYSDYRPRSDFVVAYESEPAGEIQVSAHRPDGPEPGYFAAFITPRADPEEDLRKERKLLFFLDASGSMARAELEAARKVVRRMVEALGPADRFRIGSHNILVGVMPDYLAPNEDGRRSLERHLADVVPSGASDVATSLETILAEVPDHGELVYLGEGTPTWGEKDPAKIAARVREAMGSKRITIRTVAIGSDADRNLLSTLSREFNGGAHAINPSDDVDARADEIARTLGRSAITGLKAEFEGGVTDAAPGTLGAIHYGERLLVMGRYAGGPAKLVLTGKVHDRPIRREFALALPEREPGNLHVKRLWAQRRLADLAAQGEAKNEETVRLSVAHQVMTPYTSFLVLENEKAYEEHRIDRTKKDADQTKDPAGSTASKPASKPGEFDVTDLVRQRLLDDRQPIYDGEALANLIKATIEKDSWDDASGRSCVFQNGLMVVRHTPEVQRKVTKFLTDLRDCDGGLVTIESRFLTVEDDFPRGAGDLKIHNVQDITYGLQDFPGVNITLEEDALGKKRVPFLGDLPRIDYLFQQHDIGGVGFTDTEALPRLIKAAPSDLRVDGYYAERHEGFTASPRPLPAESEPSLELDKSTTNLSTLSRNLQTQNEQILRAYSEAESRVYDSSQAVRDEISRLEEVVRERNRNPERYRGMNERMSPVQELQYLRQELEHLEKRKAQDTTRQLVDRMSQLNRLNETEQLAKDLGTIEKNYQELQEVRKRLQESIAHLHAQAVRTDPVAPRKPLAGQVTAVAEELDLVVISIGRDAGVNEGDEFTVYRGRTFVCVVVIDRVDRAWASGRVTKKGKEAARVGDQASNNVLATPGRDGMDSTWPEPPPTAELKVLGASGAIVMLSGAIKHKLEPGSRVMMWRFGKYLSAAQVTEVNGNVATAKVIQDLDASPLEKGDPALVFHSLASIWSVLPIQVRHNLISKSVQSSLRVKLHLLRTMKGGGR